MPDGFVGERAGAADDADGFFGFCEPRGLVDVTGHDADLALTWLDDSGAVRPDESGLVLALDHRLYLDHVECGDTLGDADD